MRQILNEPDPTGRFSSATLTEWLNRAQVYVALKIYWPEATMTGNWNGLQENPLTEDVLSILRVYVNGQECVPTTIPVMEGNQLEMYDQSGVGQVPEWKVLDRAPYAPISNYPVVAVAGVTGYPVPQVPGFPVRPSYYLRGANLGLVPQPVNNTPITLDIILRPPDLSSSQPNSVSVFPELFKEAIEWKAAELARASDRHFDEADWSAKKYAECIVELLKWKKQLQQQFVDRPIFVTYRSLYRGRVTGTMSGSWPT